MRNYELQMREADAPEVFLRKVGDIGTIADYAPSYLIPILERRSEGTSDYFSMTVVDGITEWKIKTLN